MGLREIQEGFLEEEWGGGKDMARGWELRSEEYDSGHLITSLLLPPKANGVKGGERKAWPFPRKGSTPWPRQRVRPPMGTRAGHLPHSYLMARVDFPLAPTPPRSLLPSFSSFPATFSYSLPIPVCLPVGVGDGDRDTVAPSSALTVPAAARPRSASPLHLWAVAGSLPLGISPVPPPGPTAPRLGTQGAWAGFPAPSA